MRSSLADRNSAAPYFAFLVGTAILTATLALEASSLIGMSRDMAGRLFYAAGISGAIATAASVGGAVGAAVKLPVRIAWMRRRIALRGLVVGNTCVVLANVLAATQVLPSLL